MNLFDFFSAYTKLPVALEDVAAFVLERSQFKSVLNYPAEFDEGALRGFCWQFLDKPPNSINHHRHAWVFYSDTLSPEMTRLVVCKEMLHLLDTPHERAGDRQQVDRLIEEIVQPFEIKAATQTHSDNGGMVMAVAVLMPAGAIEELRPSVEDGSLGFDTLSKLAGVPEMWVRAAFSPQWQEVLGLIERHYADRDAGQPQLHAVQTDDSEQSAASNEAVALDAGESRTIPGQGRA